MEPSIEPSENIDKPTVYVVTTGEYSDYRLCGVFSSPEKAAEWIGGAPDYNIEPYEVDRGPEARPQTVYQVSLLLKSGEELSRTSYRSEEVQNWSEPQILRDELAIGRSTVSFDHALKVAVEARQKYLRESAINPAIVLHMDPVHPRLMRGSDGMVWTGFGAINRSDYESFCRVHRGLPAYEDLPVSGAQA